MESAASSATWKAEAWEAWQRLKNARRDGTWQQIFEAESAMNGALERGHCGSDSGV